MRKFVIFLSTGLLFAVCSCSKDSTEEFVPLDEIVCTRTVTFDNMTKSGGDNTPLELTFTTYYNVQDERVTSFNISSSDPELDVDELKSLISARFEEENGFALENADLSQMVLTKAAESQNPTADCFNNCTDNYEKGKGRGWCKAGCIVDAVVRVVKEVADAVASVFKKS